MVTAFHISRFVSTSKFTFDEIIEQIESFQAAQIDQRPGKLACIRPKITTTKQIVR